MVGGSKAEACKHVESEVTKFYKKSGTTCDQSRLMQVEAAARSGQSGA
jgi:hypothetical protein